MKIIDLSAWQENVDWQAIADAGFGGVILKIGERSKLDDMFIDHVNNAVAHGLKYGVYYYGHAADIDTAKAEAAQVDTWIKTYLDGKNPELGIWYDAEDNSMLVGPQNVVYPITAFITALNAVGYNYVGLYSSYNWLTNEIDLTCLPDYVPIWSAQYGYHEDSFKAENPDRVSRIWQYTDHYSDDLPYDASIYYE
ncbi:GH25 family lysozyme [Pectinatus haikarae]|uniref:GH25 family lysozyme M1 (1,4-beta-N-acetylmuramidase) n=1 Tax=Pectinatus haikarae TaxID=349096 RepID=A0ABT9Y3R0_9FIRM|nr:GH25 family lysozyme [Pectinatus haikarae]MDQ0202459.1 GH25 family lysozyme M1 (1,4-beta-N-acetylmuramidase) [Pectinatus haikarae]